MRLLLISLGVVAAILFAMVAPALSLRPQRPAAVDFELAAPVTAVQAARAGSGLVSPPLDAPDRFNVVGLRWQGGGGEVAIALRVRRDGGRWTRWTSVPAEPADAPDRGSGEATGRAVSAPVWAGEADHVQYRLSRPLRGLRLHFVNTTGTATPRQRLLTTLRRSANRTLLAAAAGLGSARAQSPAPAIVPRASWAGTECEPRTTPEYGEVRAAVIHHTVTLNEYTPEQAAAAVLAICRYHRNSNGWNDIGYNFIVDRYGTIYEGRAGGVDQAVVGAQAQGYNTQTTGIANLGTHTALPQSEAALAATAKLIRWKLPLHGQPTAGEVALTSGGGSSNRYPSGTEVPISRVAGHRDGDATTCPGEALYAQLPRLRELVGNVAPRQPRTKIEASVTPTLLTFGAEARVTGRVRLLQGGPVAGVPVEIQKFERAAWGTVATTTAASDGTFSAAVTPRASRPLRARFPGNPSLVASVSRQVNVSVRPTISGAVAAAKVPVGRSALFSGAIAPARWRMVVIVERRERGRTRRVARLRVRSPNGRFAKRYRLRKPGLYRFRAVFVGDRLSLPATSRAAYVRAIRR